MKNMKKTRKLFILGLNLPFLLTPISLVSFSCAELPKLKLKTKDNGNISYDKKNDEYRLKESASAFRDYVIKNPNPISTLDPAYEIYEYEKDENGEFKRDINGQKIVSLSESGFPNLNDKINPKKLKEYYEKFFEASGFSRKYSHRIYTFTVEELFKYFPHLKSKKKYSKYLNRKNVLFMCVYYVTKSHISTGKYFDKNKPHSISEVGIYDDWLEKLKVAHSYIKGSLNPNLYNFNECVWPFFPMKLNVKGEVVETYLSKNVTDPVPLVFDRE